MSFVSDAARSRLRATMLKMESEIARLPKPATHVAGDSSPSDLTTTFADLVKQLALGPEPEVRECPACKHIGMRAATRCGYCW
ncbi:MAG TPA: hypothetical protein VHO25_08985, partial [Polyangiaceae bacterium]|nr:hypothetical protein [Polyangiaceae bacterium]